jgi:1-phosphatidylinositol phosphodiesterase
MKNAEFSMRYLFAIAFILGWLSATARAQNADWMFNIVQNGTYLSDLTIPGTHDSGAMHDPSGLAGTAKAQNLTIPQQLEAGIRFFDIRLNFSPGNIGSGGIDQTLYVYHGLIFQHIKATEVFDWFQIFLKVHPGEMIFVSIKNEAQAWKDEKGARMFQAAVEKLLVIYRDNILSTTEAPRYNSNLSDPRRIIIIRRYPLIDESDPLAPKSIDATQGWPAGNAENPISDLANANMTVQDYYDFVCSGTLHCTLENSEENTMRDDKFSVINDAFNQAKDSEGDFDGVHKLWVSFASATMHARLNLLPPKDIIPWFASYINQ